MPEIAERPVTIDEVKKRAQEKINERIEVSKDWHNPALNYTQRDYGDTQHHERVYMTFDDEEG